MTHSDLVDRDFATQKVSSVIDLLRRLLAEDYPHNDSRIALKAILRVHNEDKALLNSLSDDEDNDTVLEFCRHVNMNIVRFQQYIGMLVRSGNLRNAFEIYFPIKQIATNLLDEDTRLILSSEWMFSPFTYPVAVQQLPEFIFVGIPASESHNPLVVPLAGHELGHVVWRRRNAAQEFEPIVRRYVLDCFRSRWSDFASLFGVTAQPERLEQDLVLRRIWTQSYDVARQQVEEVFCDFLGLYLFGTGFVNSFRYLLAPSLGRTRVMKYPRLSDRAQYMEFAADKWGLSSVPGFVSAFNQQELALPRTAEFLLEVADQVTEQAYKALPELVERYSGTAECAVANLGEETSIRENLLSVVPPACASSIVPIINAGWHVRLSLDEWPILKDIADHEERRAEKLRVLRDLILKGFEVYEFRERLGQSNAA